MSRTAALVIAMMAIPAAAPVPAPTADQAMARYHAMLGAAERDRAADCSAGAAGAADQIVVCGHAAQAGPRLPMADDRFAQGEVTHRVGEAREAKDLTPPGQLCRISCEPSRLGETLVKGFHLLRSAVTGEDPDD